MRVTNAPASRERRRRRLELAKGFYGARSKLFRTATEAVDRAMIMERTCVGNIGVNAFFKGQLACAAQVIALPVPGTVGAFTKHE